MEKMKVGQTATKNNFLFLSGWGLEDSHSSDTSEILKSANVTIDTGRVPCEIGNAVLNSQMLCVGGSTQNVCQVRLK